MERKVYYWVMVSDKIQKFNHHEPELELVESEEGALLFGLAKDEIILEHIISTTPVILMETRLPIK
jgi:hypothetical protein